MSGSIDFGKLLLPVVEKLWGKPSSKAANGNRYGSKGARSVDARKGVWRDHSEEHASINGGGTLDLIERETGLAGRDAIEWLAKNGFITAEEAASGGGARKGAQRQRQKPSDEPPDLDPPPLDPPPEDPPFDPDPRPAPRPAKTPRELVGVFDYTDHSGSLIYQVQRWEWEEGGRRKKTFTQRRPSPSEPGVWINGLAAGEYMRRGPGEDWSRYDEERAARYGLRDRATFTGTPHGLYRLVELREAILSGETIFLPEGEKKVDALATLGLSGSCNSGGAANWSADLAEAFRDADVVIMLDNDEPGRKRGQTVAASLYGIARRVRVFDYAAFGEYPAKFDVADWIAQGGDAERLFGMLDRVPDYEPPKFKSKFGAVPWVDLDAPGPEHEWLIKGVLTRGERSMMAGPSQSGKSFLAVDLALAIARGEPFFGFKTMKGGVVYQAGEGGRGIKKRLRAYRQHHGLDPAEPLPFVLLPSPVDLYAGDDNTNELIAEIRHWSSTFRDPLELVVIDTLSAATPGANENASEDIGPVLARCARIAEATRAAVMLVHHMNADGTKPRGHTSIFANLDNVITVKKLENMHDADRRPIREAIVTKQKDGEDSTKWRFVLPQVRVGLDPDGDPITSCVVTRPNDKSAAPEGDDAGYRLTPKAENFLRAIYRAIERNGVIAPPELRLPINVKVVEWKYIREEFTKTTFVSDDEDGTSADVSEAVDDARQANAETIKKAMQRHGEKLLAEGIIGKVKPYIWITGRRVKGFRIPAYAERPPKPKPKPVEPVNLPDDDVAAFLSDIPEA